jgi:hypothetical protein
VFRSNCSGSREVRLNSEEASQKLLKGQPNRFATIVTGHSFGKSIADNLSKHGRSLGCVSAVDSNGRTIFVADAHRDDGKRYVARAEEKVTAFLELEAVTTQSMVTTGAAGFRGRQFLHSKTQRRRSTKTTIAIKAMKERIMQYLVLLAVVSMMALYVLIIAGCLCYIGRHGRRTS